MTHCDLLTSLPTSLSCGVLREWLTFKSVVTLDSTYCSNTLRAKFLELFQSDEYFIGEQITISKTSRFMNGLYRFGEKLRVVAFDDKLTSAQGDLFLEHCHRLTHIRYNCLESCTHELWTLLTINSHIDFLSASLTGSNYANSMVPSWKGITLPNLRALAFTGKWVTDKHCLGAMQFSKNLIQLDLSHTKIKHSTLLQIPQLCPHLTSLGLSGTRLTDDCLRAITASCVNIVHLDISYNEELTDDGMLIMVQKLSRLQSLNIEGVPLLTSLSLKHIYTHSASTLHTFCFACISAGPHFDTNAICALFQHCVKLRTVYFFADLDAGNDFGCIFPPIVLHNLTTLFLGGNCIRADSLCTIGKSCPNLRALSITSCGNYCAPSLLSICNGCVHLKELYLDINKDFDDTGESVEMSVLEEFALNLWQQLRPGLKISQTPLDDRYCVMNM